MSGEVSGARAEGTVRRRVSIRSGNRFTAAQVMRVLATVPADARLTTRGLVNEEPEVIFWWDEAVP